MLGRSIVPQFKPNLGNVAFFLDIQDVQLAMSGLNAKQLTEQESRPARFFQACTQCRDRKLKCIFESTDSTDPRPCKRCRRESKDCTLPPLKRKRYNAEQHDTPVPKRQDLSTGTNNTISNSLPEQPQIRTSQVVDATTSQPHEASAKVSNTVEPAIRNIEATDDDDAYIISTAAPWALNFLPVTFCATITDLGKAYDLQSTTESSDAASLRSTVDGEESSSLQGIADDRRPADETSTSNELRHKEAVVAVASPGRTTQAFGSDMGLDDIFHFVKFG